MAAAVLGAYGQRQRFPTAKWGASLAPSQESGGTTSEEESGGIQVGDIGHFSPESPPAVIPPVTVPTFSIQPPDSTPPASLLATVPVQALLSSRNLPKTPPTTSHATLPESTAVKAEAESIDEDEPPRQYALLEMLTRLRDRSQRGRNLRLLLLTLIAIALSVVALEIGFYPSDESDVASVRADGPVFWLFLVQSIVTAITLTMITFDRYVQEKTHLLGGATAPVPAPRAAFLAEFFLVLLHLPPGVPLDPRFSLVVFLRLYQIIRVMRDHSSVYKDRAKFMLLMGDKSNVNVDWSLAMRATFHNSPGMFVTFSTLLTALVLSFSVYIFERELDPDKWTYSGSFWFILVSMTTTGYGDFAPVTFGGQVFAVVSIIVGIALSALLVVAVITMMGMNYSEEKMVKWLSKDEYEFKEESAAASMIQRWYLYQRRRRAKKEIEMEAVASSCRKVDPVFERDMALSLAKVKRYRRRKTRNMQEDDTVTKLKGQIRLLRHTQYSLVKHVDKRFDEVLSFVMAVGSRPPTPPVLSRGDTNLRVVRQ